MATSSLSQDQLDQVMRYCYKNLKKEFGQNVKTNDERNDINHDDIKRDDVMFLGRDEERTALSTKMNGEYTYSKGDGEYTYGNGRSEWTVKDNSMGEMEDREKNAQDTQTKGFLARIAEVRRRYQAGFTMHALEHIINGTKVERVFWTLKLCLAITMAIYLSWQLFESYLHHHVDTKVNIETKTTLQLPMLFICGTQARDYLATFNDCQSNASRSHDEDICRVLRRMCPEFCLTSVNNGTCTDMTEDGNVTCNKELLGQCITVNAKGELYQTVTRPAGVYSQQVKPRDLPLWVYIKTPGTVELIPRSWFQFARINRPGDYHFILEKTAIKRLPYPYSNPSCIVQGTDDALSKNIFIGNYTLDKCLTTCYTLAQLTTCGVTHATYRALLRDPDSLSALFRNKNMTEIKACMAEKYDALSALYERCRVTCTIPCEEDSYRVTVRHEPHTSDNWTEVNIFFYYQEMKETTIEHHPSLVISTLVANFGGQLGLMAGVSAISIIELVIWIGLFLFDHFYRYFYLK